MHKVEQKCWKWTSLSCFFCPPSGHSDMSYGWALAVESWGEVGGTSSQRVFCSTRVSGFSGWIFRTPVQLTGRQCFFLGCLSPSEPPREVDGLWAGFRPFWAPWPSNPSILPTLHHFFTSVVPMGSLASFHEVGLGSWILLLHHHQRVEECVHVSELPWCISVLEPCVKRTPVEGGWPWRLSCWVK